MRPVRHEQRKSAPEKKGFMAMRKMRGFSMLEMAIVVALIMILSGITFISLKPALADARVNAGYDTTLMQMRIARQRAIQERKQYIVCFGLATPTGALTPLGAPTAQSVQIFRWDLGTALSATTQVSKVDLPSDVQFQALSGLPSPGPDSFGTGTAAIDFDQGVAAAVTNQVMFMPDGSAQDTNGNLNNGVIYIARNGDLLSSKAVSVFGSSGRIRGWRLVNVGGVNKWMQQ